MAWAQQIWLVVVIYASAGLLFGAWFVWAGVQRLDEQAVGAGVGFRLLILPGAAALWPLIVWKCVAARRGR